MRQQAVVDLGVPADERARLVALRRLGLLDTPPEERFDRLTRLAAHLAETPIALFNLIEADRQFTKSAFGMSDANMPRVHSFCTHSILNNSPFAVMDTLADRRFASSPLVSGEPGIRFYAGWPVHSPDGFAVGTLCVMDIHPRRLNDDQMVALADLARVLESEFRRIELDEALARTERLENRFATVFARSTEALILVQHDGTPVDANDSLSRILGYPPKTIDEVNYPTYVHPDDRELVDLLLTPPPIGAPTLEQVELRLRAADGSWRWFEVWAHDLSDDPSVGAVLLSARDVSAHLKSVGEQKESNDRLGAALKVAANGFLEFDAEGNLVDMNEVVWRAFARSGDTLTDFWDLRRYMVDGTGRPFPDDYTPFHDAILEGHHLRNEIVGVRLSTDDSLVIDLTIGPNSGTFDGDIRWLSVSTAPLPAADGLHTIVSVHDVTAARMLERELARQHRRYELIFEHATDVLAVVDRAGHILFASPSAERVLGRPIDDRSPGGLLALVHPDDRNLINHMFAKVLANQWDADERIVVRVADMAGEWVYLETTATNLLLEPSIDGILLSARDVTSRELLTQALAHQAMRDPLTGIFNRRALSDGLERSLARAARSGTNIGLLWVDVDNFKTVNDELGHAAGDAVLIEVTRRLTATIRTGDVVGRFGGDEFVVVLEPIGSLEDAEAMARRLLAVVSKPIRYGAIEVPCSASIGVSLSEGETDQNELLARSDAAMYRAKQGGGNGVVAG